MTTKLTILHLSDLHFGDPEFLWTTPAAFPPAARPLHDRPTLLSTLISDLNLLKAKYELWPDLVVVSGDLIHQGSRSGIEPCLDFLRDLSQALKLDRDCFMLCPGNHDLDQGIAKTDPNRALSVYAEIWNAFYAPVKDIIPPMAATGDPWTRHWLYTPADGPAVLSLNSCEILDKEAGLKHGYVGDKQLKAAAELLKKADLKEDTFRVAFLHHHLSQFHGAVGEDYSILNEVRRVLAWLRNHGFHLILHGHQHKSHLDVMVMRNHFQTITAGGSTGVSAKGRIAGAIPLQYQLLHLYDQKGGTRFPRKFNITKEEWQDNEEDEDRTILIGCPQMPDFGNRSGKEKAKDENTAAFLPLPHGSPFHWRHQLDPAWFVDRETSLGAAIERIISGSSVSVVAPVRSGRSSFLAALSVRLRSIADFTHGVYSFDLQRSLMEGTPGLLRRFCQALGGIGDTLEKIESLLIDFKKNHAQPPVFLLDEFEVLNHERFDTIGLLSWFRSLVNAKLVIFVTASPMELKRQFPKIPGSDFPNLFKKIELEPFDLKAAHVFWDRYLKGSAILFNESQKENIFQWAGGHPCKLMIGSDHLYRALLSGQKPEWKKPADREWREINP